MSPSGHIIASGGETGCRPGNYALIRGSYNVGIDVARGALDLAVPAIRGGLAGFRIVNYDGNGRNRRNWRCALGEPSPKLAVRSHRHIRRSRRRTRRGWRCLPAHTAKSGAAAGRCNQMAGGKSRAPVCANPDLLRPAIRAKHPALETSDVWQR